jgi:hypothetical protein
VLKSDLAIFDLSLAGHASYLPAQFCALG